MRSLEALLSHPVVAQVERGVVAGGAGADHHHAAGVADEDRGRHGILARMLEDDARALALADGFPERGSERARALQPLGVYRIVLPVWQHSPVIEILAIDAAARAERLAVVDLVVRGDDGDRHRARGLGDLDRLAAEPTRAAPYQHDVVSLDVV